MNSIDAFKKKTSSRKYGAMIFNSHDFFFCLFYIVLNTLK